MGVFIKYKCFFYENTCICLTRCCRFLTAMALKDSHSEIRCFETFLHVCGNHLLIVQPTLNILTEVFLGLRVSGPLDVTTSCSLPVCFFKCHKHKFTLWKSHETFLTILIFFVFVIKTFWKSLIAFNSELVCLLLFFFFYLPLCWWRCLQK